MVGSNGDCSLTLIDESSKTTGVDPDGWAGAMLAQSMGDDSMRDFEQRLVNVFGKTSFAFDQVVSDAVSSTTTGHKVLLEDRRAETIPDAIFERLDEVISRVGDEIPGGDNQDPAVALEKLRSIERTLTQNNFVCSIPSFLVSTFAEGLQRRPLSTPALMHADENQLRKSFIESHPQEEFSHVDCDLSSLLYLSIAQVLGLPVRMVEVPRHNFVRWVFENGRSLNWDTNYGYNRFTDEDYTRIYGVEQEQVGKGVYLANMSIDNVMGYFSFCRGLTFDGIGNKEAAISEYRLSVEQHPQSPLARNNLAWSYISSREAQSLITGEDALRFAEEAVSLVRAARRFDTQACVLAELGRFEEAVLVETEAYKMDPSPRYEAMIKAFGEGKTWLDLNGP